MGECENLNVFFILLLINDTLSNKNVTFNCVTYASDNREHLQ